MNHCLKDRFISIKILNNCLNYFLIFFELLEEIEGIPFGTILLIGCDICLDETIDTFSELTIDDSYSKSLF